MRDHRIRRSEGMQAVASRGTERLEYRGYDSAGIALLEDGALRYVRAVGPLERLRAAVIPSPRRRQPVSVTRDGRPTAASPRRTRIR